MFVSGLVQLGFQLPFMLRLGLLRRPRWNWGHEGVRKIGRLMLPAIFGSSVSQVALLLDTLIASFLATGSIAWLYYADRLVEFPLGVFSIALATVILPGLAAHHASQDPLRFASTLDWAVKLTTVVVLPATVALLILAGPLTVAIFHYGKFDAQDVRMSTLALMAYSIGLFGFSMVKVLAPGYFARQDTRTPVRIGIRSLLLSMGLNVVVVLPLAFLYPDRPGLHALLALNTGIGAWFNATMLYRGLRQQQVLTHSTGWRRTLWQVLAGNVAMGAFLWLLAGDTQRWLEMGALQRVGWMAILVIGGGGLYFGVLYLFGMRLQHLRVRPTAPPAHRRAGERRVTAQIRGVELVRGLHNLRPRHRGCVATIGNYDGVHCGHQHMLAAVRRRADALGLPATVVTFEPTPREFFEGATAPARLMRLREKLEALARYGIDRVVVLRFDERMRSLPAAEFEQALLVQRPRRAPHGGRA